MARGEAGAISKCATRDAEPAQGLTSHPFLPGILGGRPWAQVSCSTGTTTPPARANKGSLRLSSVPATPTQARDLPQAYRKSGGSG